MGRRLLKRGFRKRSSSIHRLHRMPLLLYIEPLEERQLLDTGFDADITVGRTLSSYTVSGIQNSEITIPRG